MSGITRAASGGVVGGASSLSTAGSIAYVASAGVLGQDPSLARSAAGRYTLYDSTPTTGMATLQIKAGAGQATANMQEWLHNNGAVLARVDPGGAIFGSLGFYLDGGGTWSMASTVMSLRSDTQILWAAVTNATAGRDLGLARDAAGRLRVSDGSTGLGQIMIASSTPASAAATGAAGTIVWDASYIYVCTAANTWKRVAIATW